MSDLCSFVNKIIGCDTPETVAASKNPKAHYTRISISLYNALADTEYYLSGSFIGVASITGGATCKIRLNHAHAEQINLREVQEIRGKFNRVYITSDGEGGILTLYICQSMETLISPKAATPFTGTVLSISGSTTNIVERMTETYHYKASEIHIQNTHAANDIELGWAGYTIPATADFRNYSYCLAAGENIKLIDVDLYYLAYCSSVDDSSAIINGMATLI